MTKNGTLAGVIDGKGRTEGMIVANPSIDNFRVAVAPVVDTDSGLWLTSKVAKNLRLKAGDAMAYAPLNTVSDNEA